MTTTLITGANKGLGFETARRLIAAGHTVYVGSRDAERGQRAAERLGARMVLIDVTDDASVAAAVKTIEADGGLDVLVNNAGIEMRIEGNVVPDAAEITADLMRSLFETNVFGVVRVTHAFLPLLRRSAVASLGSGAGKCQETGLTMEWIRVCCSTSALSCLPRMPNSSMAFAMR
jgi:NAD(P)-dependent dehydrogenase (short-subunit alcohol dehydrogenase family)